MQTKVIQHDLKIGKLTEKYFREYVTSYNYAVETQPPFQWHDFKVTDKQTNKKFIVEVKKRIGINKNTFETTIIPQSKILEWDKVKHKYNDFWMIFAFNDGNFFIKKSDLDRLAQTDNRIKVDTFQRHKGYSHKPRQHLFIPVEYLKPLDQLISC